MEVVKVLGILCIFAPLAASWTQQYGNSASTNFVNYQGPPYVGWNYSAEMSPGAGSTGMGSPSVSDEGMLFYYSKNSLIALSPKGTLLWDVEVAPIDAFDTSVTNSVYSKVHNIAVAAANWQFLTNHTTYFQMVAVHAGDGSVAWKVMDSDLYDATLICLSTSADAVYVGGFDHGTFAALSLKDGSIVWKKTNIYQIGLFMQTKVGPTEVSASEYEDVRTQEAVLLPTDPVIGINPKAGRLFSYDVSAGLTNWQSDLGFSFAAKFGISNQGMVFGSDWGGILGFGKSIFGIHSRDGSHIFNSKDYCDPSARGDGSYASGPAVDAEGYAYYRWVLVTEPACNLASFPGLITPCSVCRLQY